jgi:hypothetical protein
MRGTLVWVRDLYGDFHKRVVWDNGKRVVYITERSQFERLLKGLDAPTPIGFPREDVFTDEPKEGKSITKVEAV